MPTWAWSAPRPSGPTCRPVPRPTSGSPRSSRPEAIWCELTLTGVQLTRAPGAGALARRRRHRAPGRRAGALRSACAGGTAGPRRRAPGWSEAQARGRGTPSPPIARRLKARAASRCCGDWSVRAGGADRRRGGGRVPAPPAATGRGRAGGRVRGHPVVSAAMRVFVNAQAVEVEPGTDVRGAIRAHDPELEARAASGGALVTDARGIEVPLDGPLAAGSILRVARTRPPGRTGSPMLTRELLARLPKAELHVHLDSALRPGDDGRARARGADSSCPPPTRTTSAASCWCDDAASLEDYLARFDYTIPLLQTPGGASSGWPTRWWRTPARDGLRYLEVRYCPELSTRGRACTMERGARGRAARPGPGRAGLRRGHAGDQLLAPALRARGLARDRPAVGRLPRPRRRGLRPGRR